MHQLIKFLGKDFVRLLAIYITITFLSSCYEFEFDNSEANNPKKVDAEVGMAGQEYEGEKSTPAEESDKGQFEGEADFPDKAPDKNEDGAKKGSEEKDIEKKSPASELGNVAKKPIIIQHSPYTTNEKNQNVFDNKIVVEEFTSLYIEGYNFGYETLLDWQKMEPIKDSLKVQVLRKGKVISEFPEISIKQVSCYSCWFLKEKHKEEFEKSAAEGTLTQYILADVPALPKSIKSGFAELVVVNGSGLKSDPVNLCIVKDKNDGCNPNIDMYYTYINGSQSDGIVSTVNKITLGTNTNIYFQGSEFGFMGCQGKSAKPEKLQALIKRDGKILEELPKIEFAKGGCQYVITQYLGGKYAHPATPYQVRGRL